MPSIVWSVWWMSCLLYTSQVAAQGADALTPHGVALVRHGGGTNLVLLKRFFHLLEVSQQAQVGGKLHAALGNACLSLIHI